MIPIGERRHLVSFENPAGTNEEGSPITLIVGDVTPDGDGGYTQEWLPFTSLWVKIMPASQRELERVVVGGAGVQSSASHIVTGPYHAGVTTKTRLTFRTRVFQVTGKANVEERDVEMVLTCTEVVA